MNEKYSDASEIVANSILLRYDTPGQTAKAKRDKLMLGRATIELDADGDAQAVSQNTINYNFESREPSQRGEDAGSRISQSFSNASRQQQRHSTQAITQASLHPFTKRVNQVSRTFRTLNVHPGDASPRSPRFSNRQVSRQSQASRSRNFDAKDPENEG